VHGLAQRRRRVAPCREVRTNGCELDRHGLDARPVDRMRGHDRLVAAPLQLERDAQVGMQVAKRAQRVEGDAGHGRDTMRPRAPAVPADARGTVSPRARRVEPTGLGQGDWRVRVLVIEDSAPTRELLVRSLTETGMSVVTASRYSTGLRQAMSG